MAKNITLMGASYPDVPAVILPQTGGGTALFTDVSDTDATAADVMIGKKFYLPDGTLGTGTFLNSPYGSNCSLVQDLGTSETALKDTGFNTWTPSTTASVIETAVDYPSYISCDLTSKEYIVLYRTTIDYKYTTLPTNMYLKTYVFEQMSYILKSPPDYNAVVNENFSYTTTNTVQNYMFSYKNTNGNFDTAWLTTAGIYANYSSVALSMNSYMTTLVKPRTPTLRAICLEPYLSVANAALIDKDNTKIKTHGWLLSYDKVTSMFSAMRHDLVNMHNNP